MIVPNSQEAIAKESFFPQKPVLTQGNIDQGFAEADHTIDGELHVEAQEHFYLETQGGIAYPTEDGGIDIISATQSPNLVQVCIVLVFFFPLIFNSLVHS